MSSNDPHEPVTVTDKRRVDPETGEIRPRTQGAENPQQATGPAPSGPAPAAAPSGSADKVAELTADLQRVQADFANYRKRALRDQQLIADRAKAGVIAQLLGVLDDLDRARSHGDLESGPLKSVADKLVTALEGLGLSGFGAEGDEFDPALHEAVQHESADVTGPTVTVLASVLRRGYRIGDRVLRPAMVVVVRHAMVGVVDTVPAAGETADNADAPPVQDAESIEQDN